MLSEKIKELRKKNGLTQEDLANGLNVSRNHKNVQFFGFSTFMLVF